MYQSSYWLGLENVFNLCVCWLAIIKGQYNGECYLPSMRKSCQDSFFRRQKSIFNPMFVLHHRARTHLTKYCVQPCYVLFLQCPKDVTVLSTSPFRVHPSASCKLGQPTGHQNQVNIKQDKFSVLFAIFNSSSLCYIWHLGVRIYMFPRFWQGNSSCRCTPDFE